MWPVYVINLADNTERMANAAAALSAQGIEFERIEAVNGWALGADEIARVYDKKSNARRARKPLLPAEIGCYLSHISVWQKIAGGLASGGFIFEDDLAATESLGSVLLMLGSRNANSHEAGDWDLVKLFSYDPSPRTIERHPLGPGHEIVIPYRVPNCSIGYGLTRDAAARLAAGAIPFFRPVDEDQKYFWETGLKVALVLPPPVILGDDIAATGTVSGERRKARAKVTGISALGRGIRGLIYAIRYRILLYWHRARQS